MNRIQIPARLKDRLGESALGHAVRLYVEQIEKWVGDNTKGLFFFPDYTDHGPKHITSVLAGAEALIREEAWDVLTPEDVAVLVLATLLHDSAMHLTADGLMDLLDPTHIRQRPLIDLLDDKTWPQIFDDFFVEARRWDQRKLRRILGDASVPEEEEEDLIDYVRRPAPIGEAWPEPYRKFIGEFLRRHHARLAHEIALYGVPGHKPGTLRPENELDAIADIAGLVARSHNMHLRQTFDYLKQKYWGRVTCQGAHPVFLMVLLRIADYLEIRSDRTNLTLRNLQHLRSPLSREEHDAHRAIHEVRLDEHDDAAVFVIARPKSALLFLKIRDLLGSLQKEIDTSWAVLGEVFSRQGNLSRLSITLRRVRSNIDDAKQFVERENPSYFPIQACFDTAGADLLKLLVRPLYGDRPDIGVRELLQNSLDAVHEFRLWIATHKSSTEESWKPLGREASVVISLTKDEHGGNWLIVADKGIGMTAEIVRDYFLKAGASYRQSAAWRQSFEVDGRSKVLRSGRFGIGALAAFLLGSKLEVFTRHAASKPEDGVHLRASITDNLIELSRIAQPDPGTTIRIPLSHSTANRLRNSDSWDWYMLDDPEVQRTTYGSTHEPRYRLSLGVAKAAPNDWRQVTQPYYQKVLWSYSSAPALACNGIVVQHKAHKSFLPPWRLLSGGFLELPHICIFDPDGKLPLRLERERLEEELPCLSELTESVVKDFLAWLLTRSIDALSPNRFLRTSWLGDIGRAIDYTDFLLVSAQGFTLFHPWFMKRADLQSAVITVGPGRLPTNKTPTMQVAGDEQLSYQLSYIELGGIRPDKVATLRRYSWDANGSENVQWVIDRESRDDPDLTEIRHSLIEQKVNGISGAVKLHIDPSRMRSPSSLFTDMLEELIDHPVIPFDPAERRTKFPKAFDVLREYIETWERPDLMGWRKEMIDPVRSEGSAEISPAPL